MRVVDTGLRCVAGSLGVTYDARTWSGIGDTIQKKMEQKHRDKIDAWKQAEPFYASVLTDIQAISRGHRNAALHDIARKYTESEAFYLITVVTAFIKHLADNGMQEIL